MNREEKIYKHEQPITDDIKEKSNKSEIEVIFNDYDIGSNEYTLLIPKKYRRSIIIPNCNKDKTNSILAKIPSFLGNEIAIVDVIEKLDMLTIVYCEKELISKIYLSLLINLPKLRIKECILTESDKFYVTNCLDENNLSIEYAHKGPNGENDYPHSFVIAQLDEDEIEVMRKEFDINNDFIRIVNSINNESDSESDIDFN